MTCEELISDEEITRVHANANFGSSLTKRMIVKQALLKCACGYHNGSTAQSIIAEHGLIRGTYRRGYHSLTPLGRKYLWAAFGDQQF